MEIAVRVTLGPVFLLVGCLLIYYVDGRRSRLGRLLFSLLGLTLTGLGLGAFFLPVYWDDECEEDEGQQSFHTSNIRPKAKLADCNMRAVEKL